MAQTPVRVTRQDDLAVVTIDNPPVNAASHGVRQGLLDALAQTEHDPKVRAVVLACAGRTFVAGADIREFDTGPNPPALPDVIRAIEDASKPWVAALHGTALGGGLELAMGCHGRVAVPGARMGLPEVALGLIPGAGGTVRLPRLVDVARAVEMVAGGKPIDAATALDAGLIDALAQGDLLEAAAALARGLTTPEPTLARPLRGTPEDLAAPGAALRAKARGQISVGAGVDAVERALTLDADTALAAERAAFLDLKGTEQSTALRHIFFAERATLKDPRVDGPGRPITHVGIVGGGTMGAGIAAACVMGGLPVTLIDRDTAQAGAGRARVTRLLEGSAARGLLGSVDGALTRFQAHAEQAALAQADLVIEAVFEDMAVKQDLFRRLDAVTRPDAILATNTSYLDVAEIAGVLKDPSRALGLHFFSPAHIMKLLEIVVPRGVAPDAVATGAALAKRLGKIAVLAGVCDGFIGNRIMSAYRAEAEQMLLEGALPEQVDAAMRDYGYAMGIFETQDMAGLDISWAMRRRRAEAAGTVSDTIADALCAQGRHGRKTGAGWYDYVQGKPVPSPLVTALIVARRHGNGHASPAIMDRILGRMRAEAQAVLNDGIARSAADIDVVMVHGYGYPRWRGGPMETWRQPS